jgi:hypothetical protein
MADEDFVPMNFIYAGLRLGKDKKPLMVLIPMQSDGVWAEERWFSWDKKRRVVGGIYKGASFSATKGRFVTSIYTGEDIDDTSKITMWEAETAETNTRIKAHKLEGDARRHGVIVEAMTPLRELYTKAMSAGDYSGAHALETAVVQALRKPYKENE